MSSPLVTTRRRFQALSSLKLSSSQTLTPSCSHQIPFPLKNKNFPSSLFLFFFFDIACVQFNSSFLFNCIAASKQNEQPIARAIRRTSSRLFLLRLAGNSSIRARHHSKPEWAVSTTGVSTRETASWIDLPALADPGASRRLAPWVVQCPSCPTFLKCPSPSFSVLAGISMNAQPGTASRLDTLTTTGLTSRPTISGPLPGPRPNRRPSAEAERPGLTRASGLRGDDPLVSYQLCVPVQWLQWFKDFPYDPTFSLSSPLPCFSAVTDSSVPCVNLRLCIFIPLCTPSLHSVSPPFPHRLAVFLHFPPVLPYSTTDGSEIFLPLP